MPQTVLDSAIVIVITLLTSSVVGLRARRVAALMVSMTARTDSLLIRVLLATNFGAMVNVIILIMGLTSTLAFLIAIMNSEALVDQGARMWPNRVTLKAAVA